MSRMSELHLEITNAIAAGRKPEEIVATWKKIGYYDVPLNWVKSVEDDFYNEQNEQNQYADHAADADAIAYGSM